MGDTDTPSVVRVAHEDAVAVLEAFVLDNPEAQRVEAMRETMEGTETGRLAAMLPPLYVREAQLWECSGENEMKARPNHQVYIGALRAMSGEDRLRKALELSALTRELLMTGLRRRHPEVPESELHQLYLRRLQKSWDRAE